jgi:hypothetical protein
LGEVVNVKSGVSVHRDLASLLPFVYGKLP